MSDNGVSRERQGAGLLSPVALVLNGHAYKAEWSNGNMSIFTTPIPRLGEPDLTELLQDNAVENVRLEFKRDVPVKDESLKKLSSFANTFGGYIVVGAEADSKDGRLIRLPGVDIQSGYKQTIVQWCFGGVSPPLSVDVSDPIPAPGGSGKVCYVLFVRESDLAPHFLNGRKGVYVRTNEFSARFEASLATESEMRHLLNRRDLIRNRRTTLIDRARLRFQSFTDTQYHSFRKDPAKEPGESLHSIGARFDLTIVPRFPAEPISHHEALITLVKSKHIAWRGVGFPRDFCGPVSQHESVIILGPGSTFSILEANVWGMLFFGAEIEVRKQDYEGIHYHQFLGNVLAFVRYAGDMLSEFGYAGPLRVEMRMEGMRGVKWIRSKGDLQENGRSSMLDDLIVFSLDTTTDELTNMPDTVALSILRYVFFATNLAQLAGSPQQLENIRREAYEFNGWSEPK